MLQRRRRTHRYQQRPHFMKRAFDNLASKVLMQEVAQDEMKKAVDKLREENIQLTTNVLQLRQQLVKATATSLPLPIPAPPLPNNPLRIQAHHPWWSGLYESLMSVWARLLCALSVMTLSSVKPPLEFLGRTISRYVDRTVTLTKLLFFARLEVRHLIADLWYNISRGEVWLYAEYLFPGKSQNLEDAQRLSDSLRQPHMDIDSPLGDLFDENITQIDNYSQFKDCIMSERYISRVIDFQTDYLRLIDKVITETNGPYIVTLCSDYLQGCVNISGVDGIDRSSLEATLERYVNRGADLRRLAVGIKELKKTRAKLILNLSSLQLISAGVSPWASAEDEIRTFHQVLETTKLSLNEVFYGAENLVETFISCVRGVSSRNISKHLVWYRSREHAYQSLADEQELRELRVSSREDDYRAKWRRFSSHHSVFWNCYKGWIDVLMTSFIPGAVSGFIAALSPRMGENLAAYFLTVWLLAFLRYKADRYWGCPVWLLYTLFVPLELGGHATFVGLAAAKYLRDHGRT